MTTVLADFHLGIIVADSSISDADRVWRGRKVFHVNDALIGFAGNVEDWIAFRAWFKDGAVASKKPKLTSTFMALVMSGRGLFTYYSDLVLPCPVPGGREAIGSGAKAAMCAYEALAWKDPKRAVQIVCRHDSGSRAPVRVYHLKKHGRQQTTG